MRTMERIGAFKRCLVTAQDGMSRAYEACVGAWARWRIARPYPLQQVDESMGDYGERLAALYLERSGYVILERSMSTRLGEIDLIAAWRGKQIVFVEVKTWAHQRINAGGPADAVDDVKQRKITHTALTYMKRHGLLETAGRMDVIEVTFAPETRKPLFRHFVNAFEAVGQFQMFS
jgi:putative endonuclease